MNKNKNRFLNLFYKALAFIVVFVLVDISLGKVFCFLESKAVDNSPYGMSPEYTMWKVNTDAVIIGASEASHSYVPEILEQELGISFYNCGLDGMRFYYQNAMIHGILDRYSPRLIIWSITPDFLSVPTKNDMDRLSRLNPFYKTNDFCNKILLNKSKYEFIKLLCQQYVFNSRLLPYLFKIYSEDYDFKKGAFVPLYGELEEGVNTHYEWNKEFDQSLEIILYETLERCKKQGVKVLFVFTPMYRDEKHDDLDSYIHLKWICDDLNIGIIEHLYHNEDLMKKELFRDPAHFNEKGAILFSKTISKDISFILKDNS